MEFSSNYYHIQTHCPLQYSQSLGKSFLQMAGPIHNIVSLPNSILKGSLPLVLVFEITSLFTSYSQLQMVIITTYENSTVFCCQLYLFIVYITWS